VISAGKKYHFVGIGGAGMSGLAAVMLAGGVRVSGSDLQENKEILQLRRAGAHIHMGHDPYSLDSEIDGVIISSAVGEENAEVKAARQHEVPVVRRLHALATVLRGYRSIGVAGDTRKNNHNRDGSNDSKRGRKGPEATSSVPTVRD